MLLECLVRTLSTQDSFIFIFSYDSGRLILYQAVPFPPQIIGAPKFQPSSPNFRWLQLEFETYRLKFQFRKGPPQLPKTAPQIIAQIVYIKVVCMYNCINIIQLLPFVPVIFKHLVLFTQEIRQWIVLTVAYVNFVIYLHPAFKLHRYQSLAHLGHNA